MTPPFQTELQQILQAYSNAQGNSRHDDTSDVLSISQVSGLIARCVAAIERAAGRQSKYSQRLAQVLSQQDHDWNRLARAIGVVDALHHDLQQGFTKSIEELLHADVFSDFLEMAQHLLDSGYKDAGAVIAGTTLEAHLKQLATKFGVPTDKDGKPKKADSLNTDLVKEDAYSKLDQKNVTAWLGLRNNAAHGNYTEYDKTQVSLMIQSIRDFVTRNPA
jgi:hypothetical protein